LLFALGNQEQPVELSSIVSLYSFALNDHPVRHEVIVHQDKVNEAGGFSLFICPGMFARCD